LPFVGATDRSCCMRPRHATALALVGWYLMAPPAFPGRADMPLSENMPADRQFDEHAPLSRWSPLGTTQTAAECRAARGRLRHDPQPLIRLIGRVSDCIASDDPRLKKNSQLSKSPLHHHRRSESRAN